MNTRNRTLGRLSLYLVLAVMSAAMMIGRGLTYANPLRVVLEALKVDLLGVE